jgi:LacI family transcriptional regulator
MSATLNELAARLNLSKSSVSRILNNKGNAYSAETRRRVFALAEELGYAPDPVARALATGRTGLVALWVRDLLSSYHAHVAHIMQERLAQHEYRMVVAMHGRPDFLSEGYGPAQGRVDGIIAHEDLWIGPHMRTPSRIPVISTGVSYNAANRDFVGIELTDAAIAAVRHLLEPGRRRVAYLMHGIPWREGDLRYRAYQTVMGEAGLLTEYIDPPAEDRATVRYWVREYIQANGCPEAIFCHSDDVAVATYRGLCDLGIRVPDDVALFGCDGIEETEYMATPLSTIAQPLEVMCDTAWRFMQRRLAEPDAPPQQVILQPTLVLRESSRS